MVLMLWMIMEQRLIFTSSDHIMINLLLKEQLFATRFDTFDVFKYTWNTVFYKSFINRVLNRESSEMSDLLLTCLFNGWHLNWLPIG